MVSMVYVLAYRYLFKFIFSCCLNPCLIKSSRIEPLVILQYLKSSNLSLKESLTSSIMVSVSGAYLTPLSSSKAPATLGVAVMFRELIAELFSNWTGVLAALEASETSLSSMSCLKAPRSSYSADGESLSMFSTTAYFLKWELIAFYCWDSDSLELTSAIWSLIGLNVAVW